MVNTILDIILHNLLVRELFVVFLIVIVILRYIHHYTKASRSTNQRIRTRKMGTPLKDTRTLLILLVVVLVGVLGYDRIWPHFSGQPVQSHKVAKQKTTSIKVASSKSSVKAKVKKTSASSASIKGAVTATSGSVTIPDGSMSKKKAAAIVANYFAKNPSESAQASDAYKCLKVGNGDASIAVYMVTGYVKNNNGKLKAKHMYWVYASEKFTTKY